MFSVRQKREIADKVQAVLRETAHPELPPGEIAFTLHVDGAQPWSWADIRNNGAVATPSVNPHNEAMASDGRARELAVAFWLERMPGETRGEYFERIASRWMGKG